MHREDGTTEVLAPPADCAPGDRVFVPGFEHEKCGGMALLRLMCCARMIHLVACCLMRWHLSCALGAVPLLLEGDLACSTCFLMCYAVPHILPLLLCFNSA